MALTKTCKCGEPIEESKSRCTECGNCAVRISRELQGKSEEFKEAYYANSRKMDKAAFLQDARTKFGFDLSLIIAQVAENRHAYSKEVVLKGTGTFLDKADLELKYKGKPERLQGILANCSKMNCPISGIELFEDMEFQRVMTDSSTSTSAQSLKGSTEETISKEAQVIITDGGQRSSQRAPRRDAS